MRLLPGTNGSTKRSKVYALFLAYKTDEERCSGAKSDSFNRKNSFFQEKCDQAELNEEERQPGFSVIFCSQARNYYLDTLKDTLALAYLGHAVNSRFHTAGRARSPLREW